MPPLTLKPLLEEFSLRMMFSGNGSLSMKSAQLTLNMVRLVDKAAREYELARRCIDEQIIEEQRYQKSPEEGYTLTPILRFTDHMENCLNATNRVLTLHKALRSDSVTSRMQDRDRRKRILDAGDPIRKIRDLSEHINKAIHKGEIGKDQPIMLKLGDDQSSVRIGQHVIALDTLADVLRHAHTEAAKFLVAPSHKMDTP